MTTACLAFCINPSSMIVLFSPSGNPVVNSWFNSLLFSQSGNPVVNSWFNCLLFSPSSNPVVNYWFNCLLFSPSGNPVVNSWFTLPIAKNPLLPLGGLATSLYSRLPSNQVDKLIFKQTCKRPLTMFLNVTGRVKLVTEFCCWLVKIRNIMILPDQKQR